VHDKDERHITLLCPACLTSSSFGVRPTIFPRRRGKSFPIYSVSLYLPGFFSRISKGFTAIFGALPEDSQRLLAYSIAFNLPILSVGQS
jgi:hypothetical protein